MLTVVGIGSFFLGEFDPDILLYVGSAKIGIIGFIFSQNL
jgi:hypothetical protein